MVGRSRRAKPLDLPSHTHSFTSHIRSRILRARLRHVLRSTSRVWCLHAASVVTLVVYSTVVGLEWTASVPLSSFDGRWMGVLVSLTVMGLDGLLSLVSGDVQPWLLLTFGLMTRLLLASFDENSWYVGYSVLFSLYSLLLVRLIVSSYLPWWGVRISGKPRGLSVEAKPMTLQLLLSSPPPLPDSFPKYAQPLASVINSAAHPSTLWKVLLLTLITGHLMATTVAYITSPPLYSSFPQYQIGLLVLLSTFIASVVFLQVRLLFFYSFHLNWPTVGCGLMLEALFAGCGMFVWANTGSWLVLLLSTLLPPFGVSLLSTWTLSICDVSQRWSHRSLVSIGVCVLLLTGVGLSVSELYSLPFVGWALVLCLLIGVTGSMPLVKFHSTLTLDGMDELAIVTSLTLLAGLLGLLCQSLGLDLLPSLLLVAGGCAFPVLLIVIGAFIEYHHCHRASPLCVLAVSVVYVYLLALSALTLAVVDFSIGVLVCIASVAVILFSSLFLYWRHRRYRLPALLRLFFGLLLGGVVVAGVLLSVYLAMWYDGGEGVELPFFAFSGTWFFLLSCLLLYALMSHFGAMAAAPSSLYFSHSLFPVYRYNKRTGSLSLLHTPLMLTLLCVLMLLLWGIRCPRPVLRLPRPDVRYRRVAGDVPPHTPSLSIVHLRSPPSPPFPRRDGLWRKSGLTCGRPIQWDGKGTQPEPQSSQPCTRGWM